MKPEIFRYILQEFELNDEANCSPVVYDYIHRPRSFEYLIGKMNAVDLHVYEDSTNGITVAGGNYLLFTKLKNIEQATNIIKTMSSAEVLFF